MWQGLVAKQTAEYIVQEAERRGKTGFFNPLGGQKKQQRSMKRITCKIPKNIIAA